MGESSQLPAPSPKDAGNWKSLNPARIWSCCRSCRQILQGGTLTGLCGMFLWDKFKRQRLLKLHPVSGEGNSSAE